MGRRFVLLYTQRLRFLLPQVRSGFPSSSLSLTSAHQSSLSWRSGIFSDQPRNSPFSQMVDRNTLLDLPFDMLRIIMICAGGDSVKDFIKMKLCCTELKALGEEPYILQRISLWGLRYWEFDRKHASFLRTCIDNNNPEALYRAGVDNFFAGESRTALALVQLMDSSDAGHLFATYTLAVILIFNWDRDVPLVEQGFRLLRMVCVAGKELECRRNLIKHVSIFWGGRGSTELPPLPQARCRHNHFKAVHLWTEEYITFGDPGCIDCRCDAEVQRLMKTFRWGDFPVRCFK